MPKILISDSLDKQAVERLKQTAGFEVSEKPDISAEDLLKEIKEYDALLVRSRTKATKEVIEAGENLKFIGRAGVGLDNVDLETAKAKNIEVMNTPEAPSAAVAEHAIGLIFCMAKNFCQACQSLKEGRWEKKSFKNVELAGKTLGLVGVGRIGKVTAEKAKMLGMEVLAYDPYLKPEDVKDAKLTDLDEVIKNSHYISIHVPLTPETKGMINKEVLMKMKPGVNLINCARGGIINEEDLLELIKSGHMGCVALDVYENEPEINKDLMAESQVIGTPHIASSTKEAQARCGEELVDKVIEFFQSKK